MADRNYTCVASAMQSSKKSPIKVGDTFITNQGCTVTVFEYCGSLRVGYQFNDEHQHKAYTTTQNLKKGQVKNPYLPVVCGVGYFGVGKYESVINSKHTDEYRAWRDMLRRCYDDYSLSRRPTYKDCYVCDEWHNFQNFAEWYTNQEYYGKGYHLDKDLLIDGNKVYSPSTCVLAPQELNALLATWLAEKTIPTGVSFDKKTGKYLAYVTLNKKRKYLGYFSSINEARDIYLAEKLITIKAAALNWKDRIDDKLFNALMAKTA